MVLGGGALVTSERVPLFELDPELAGLLAGRDRAAAGAAALVELSDLPVGGWSVTDQSAPVAGFLVVRGCLTREISVLGQTMTLDFLAHGDVLHTSVEPVMTSVPSQSAWSVLEPTRLALLDAALLTAIQPWPQVTAALLRRQERRCGWLADVLAISHLPRVESKILVLFWLFADRWGHRTGQGVKVPIPLTHLNIARLVGAQRPTVTTAIGQLVAGGVLTHVAGGHWTLYGDPPQSLER